MVPEPEPDPGIKAWPGTLTTATWIYEAAVPPRMLRGGRPNRQQRRAAAARKRRQA